jgi:hypothetical protein
VPELSSETDTRYFDDDIEDAPLVRAGVKGVEVARDPLLRDPELLDIRKELAFKGYTFRHQRHRVIDPRYGVLNVRLEGVDELKGRKPRGKERSMGPASRLRARALSL